MHLLYLLLLKPIHQSKREGAVFMRLCCLLPTGPPWGAGAINVPFLCQVLLSFLWAKVCPNILYNSTEIWGSHRKLVAATDMASWNSFPLFGLPEAKSKWGKPEEGMNTIRRATQKVQIVGRYNSFDKNTSSFFFLIQAFKWHFFCCYFLGFLGSL